MCSYASHLISESSGDTGEHVFEDTSTSFDERSSSVIGKPSSDGYFLLSLFLLGGLDFDVQWHMADVLDNFSPWALNGDNSGFNTDGDSFWDDNLGCSV